MTTQIVTTESLLLTRTKAPALPVAPTNYNREYIDELNRILRLYFNTVDNFVGQLSANSTSIISNLRLPYGAFHQDGETTLSVGITNVSTTPIQVASTAGFPSSGWLIIENEIISYTTKTATTFDGTITRGVLGTTNVAHTAGLKVTEAQGTGSATTIGQVLFNYTDLSSGVSVNALDESKVVFADAGVYNIQFSVQLLNYTTNDDNVTVWFKKNGTDIANSASIEQVNPKHGTKPGAVILALNFVDSFTAGDYIELYWASDTGETVLGTYPPGTSPTHPASPGVIMTVSFVSHI